MERMVPMTKHTPGPWRVDAGCPRQVIWYDGARMRVVATCSDNLGLINGAVEEAMANARLIAAAPELLESLKWAMKHVENVFALAYRFDHERPLLEAARNAIAKATGEKVR
jgi:hypothetical protein